MISDLWKGFQFLPCEKAVLKQKSPIFNLKPYLETSIGPCDARIIYWLCRTQSIFGDTVYSCYCKLRLMTPPPTVGTEGTKIFYFAGAQPLSIFSHQQINFLFLTFIFWVNILPKLSVLLTCIVLSKYAQEYLPTLFFYMHNVYKHT